MAINWYIGIIIVVYFVIIIYNLRYIFRYIALFLYFIFKFATYLFKNICLTTNKLTNEKFIDFNWFFCRFNDPSRE